MKKKVAICSLVLCSVLIPSISAIANKVNSGGDSVRPLIEKNLENKVLYKEVLSNVANYENVSGRHYFKFVGDVTNKLLGEDLKGKNNIALKFDNGVLHIYTCDDISGLDVPWKHHTVKDIETGEDGTISSFKKEPTTDTLVTDVDLKGKTGILRAKSVGGKSATYEASVSAGNTSGTISVKKTVEPLMNMVVGKNKSVEGVEVPIKFEANMPFDLTVIAKEPVNEYGVPLKVDKNFSGKFVLAGGKHTNLVTSKEGILKFEDCSKSAERLIINPLSYNHADLPVGVTTFDFELIMSMRGR